MKALAIDCAVTRLTVAAKDDHRVVKTTYDIGMKQSEKLLPAIDSVLKELDISAKDLDYTTITIGPGSFTGLRLGLSALKALEMANKTPIYGVSTLDAYAMPYDSAIENVLSVIFGNKEQFYNCFYVRGNKVTEEADSSIDEILNEIDPENDVLVVGPDADIFVNMVKDKTPLYGIHYFDFKSDCTESLFQIAEKMIADKKEPCAEYEGPVYLRKSEAEIVLEKNKSAE